MAVCHLAWLAAEAPVRRGEGRRVRRNHLRAGWGDKGRNTFGHGERDLLIFREERGKVAMTSSTLSERKIRAPFCRQAMTSPTTHLGAAWATAHPRGRPGALGAAYRADLSSPDLAAHRVETAPGQLACYNRRPRLPLGGTAGCSVRLRGDRAGGTSRRSLRLSFSLGRADHGQ
jgi:hypothetical protein